MAGTRKKRPGRHKATCRCVNCNMRRKAGREAAAAQSPDLNLSGPSGIEKSSEPGATAESFAAQSAAIVAEAGAAGVVPASGEPPAPDPQMIQLPYGMVIDIRQQTIKQHWLPMLSKAVIAATHDEEMGLAEWEEEIWAPAVTGIVNHYLPSLLENTDRPEWAMLGVAATTYAVVRLHKFGPLLRKVPGLGKLIPGATSAPGTSMPASAESQACSAPLAPEKPIAPQSLSVDAIAAFGSTQ